MKKLVSIILIVALLVSGGIWGYNHVQDLIAESYESGYDAGYDNGREAGYRQGKKDGYTDGHAEGYTEGQESALKSQSGSSSGGNYTSQSSGGSSSSSLSAGYYIGNANTGVFHYPGCSYLPEQQNRVVFYSRSSAISQGYTPCSHCNP